MAAALTLIMATPTSLRYAWSTDGAGSQTASRTRVQMLADAATAPASGYPGASPLLALLTASTGAAWLNMDEAIVKGPANRLAVSARVRTSTNGVCAKATFVSAPADQLDITAQAGGGAVANGDTMIVNVRLYSTLS